MMMTLLFIFILLLIIGFMWGGFIALLVAVIALMSLYFIGLHGALGVVAFIAIGSAILKFKGKV